MRRTAMTETWTDPTGGPVEDYRHMSYVLFRLGGGRDEILGARCPDMSLFAVGESVCRALELSREAEAYIGSGETDEIPLFVWTRVGVGVLLKTYARSAGVGLYVHIHGRPASLARLLVSGVLGQAHAYRLEARVMAEGAGRPGVADEASYVALADAFGSISAYIRGGWLSIPDSGRVYRLELEGAMARLAAFVGCGVRYVSLPVDGVFDREGARPWMRDVDEITCYRPLLLEAVLLCLVTQARALSATRSVRCCISTVTGRDGDNLSLSMQMPLDEGVAADIEQGAAGGMRRYLSWISEVYGLEITTGIAIQKGTARRANPGREMTVSVVWLTDPAVLPTTDLKAGVRLWPYGE